MVSSYVSVELKWGEAICFVHCWCPFCSLLYPQHLAVSGIQQSLNKDLLNEQMNKPEWEALRAAPHLAHLIQFSRGSLFISCLSLTGGCAPQGSQEPHSELQVLLP